MRHWASRRGPPARLIPAAGPLGPPWPGRLTWAGWMSGHGEPRTPSSSRGPSARIRGCSPRWVVVVWNDPVNLMTYVTYVFRKLFGYSQPRRTR